MPTEPELGITAPCRVWCTLAALFTSCNSLLKYQTEETLQENTREDCHFSTQTMNCNTNFGNSKA